MDFAKSVFSIFLLAILIWENEGKPSTSLRKRRDLAEAELYLAELEPLYSSQCNTQMLARWAYITNVTAENEAASLAATTAFLKYQGERQMEIIEKFDDYEDYNNEMIKRELKFLRIQGPADMPENKIKEMNDLMGTMESAYGTAHVCKYGVEEPCANPEDQYKLDPDIEKVIGESKDYDELAYYYTKWHDVMGVTHVTPQKYKQFIDLQNEMAVANGFSDMSEMWLAPYEDGTDGWTAANFKQQMLDIWTELKPLYMKLHAYVRMKLRGNENYAAHFNKADGYIPANLLGNLWAQDWSALDAETKPFPEEPSLDATAAMIEKGYTVDRMFRISEEFFTGMGLEEMTATFWEKSMIELPTDRDVICHASAEDFCLGKDSEDFRIKQCTKVTMSDLVTVHHEMGHIEYFQLYKHLNFIFRNGANPGFHEAIGDALALAVTTPNHLQCALELNMGLEIDCTGENPSSGVTPMDINFLYIMALQKFAFFPFAIAMDQWRWEVFEGKIEPDQYNDRWWELRKEYQGITPPSPRPPTAFDPAAKYHIVANVPYIRYFVSHILQFQFYEAMCVAAGKFDPADPDSKLYQCDFAGNANAGTLLRNMMEFGFSKPWPEALSAITDSPDMSIESLLRYFKPLFDQIDGELEQAKEIPCIGVTDCMTKYLEQKYEGEASEFCNKAAIAEWNYNVDLDNDTLAEDSNKANLAFAEFKFKEWEETIKGADYEIITSPLVQRQVKFLQKVGTAALSTEDLEKFNAVTNEMTKIFGSSKVCPYRKQNCNIETEGVNLDPELEATLSTSTDYYELTYVWEAWRRVTGSDSKMKELYQQYVELSNKAAVANDEENMGDLWILGYESETFREDMKAVWEDVKELYEKLYGYVRFRLKEQYPEQLSDPDALLPANILGNMWAQQWDNIYPLVLPFPDADSFDVTEKMKETFTDDHAGVTKMFELANEFFVDLGLSDMSMAYSEKAMIRRPAGKNVICHASAWDFCDKQDYRIKMCTKIEQGDLITIHHELGHIQYDLNYKTLPITLREGANPGFHEAIGDVVALSVETPEHMRKINLMDPGENNLNTTINYLMKMALQKIAFLPFGYMIDAYRWQIFDGTIAPDQYEYYWLKLRAELQGLRPPVLRSERDFDAGAKYHVPGNTPYIRYFVSFILQFQVHKALCLAAGHDLEQGLHTCDIDGNPAAGAKFKQILEAGFSKNWQDLLEDVTGSRNLDATAIKDYFKILTDYFDEQQALHEYQTNWNADVEGWYSKESPPGDDDGYSPETAAIVIGAILGVSVLVLVAGYFLKAKICKK